MDFGTKNLHLTAASDRIWRLQRCGLKCDLKQSVTCEADARGRGAVPETSAKEISTDKFEQTEAILKLTPPQTAEEQELLDEYTESSSSQASAPVVCSQ